MKLSCFTSATLRLAFVWLFLFFQTNKTYSQTWSHVGPPGFSAGSATYTCIAFDGSTPFVAFSDGSLSNKATVQKFDGANWVPVENG